MSVAEITLGALITGVFGRYSQLIIKDYIDRNIMAILDILYYPDKRLRTVAKPVEKVDDSIKKLVEASYSHRYIGRQKSAFMFDKP
jgi:hypothetical protein